MEYQISVFVFKLYNEKSDLSNTEVEGKPKTNYKMILFNLIYLDSLYPDSKKSTQMFFSTLTHKMILSSFYRCQRRCKKKK